MPNLDDIMPHRPPMRMLEEVFPAGEGRAGGRMCVGADNPFLREDGLLERAAFPEIMAQCFAAAAGAKAKTAREAGSLAPSEGYLAALRHIVVHEDVKKGDTLDIAVEVVAELSGVTVVAATVHCGATLLAEGELKIYIPDPLPTMAAAQPA